MELYLGFRDLLNYDLLKVVKETNKQAKVSGSIKAWIEDTFEGPKQWWWKSILKLNAPLKSKIST